MKIIIDERETSLYEKCRLVLDESPGVYKLQGISITKTTLHLGDIHILTDDGKDVVIIERKSLKDLLSSIKDGRYDEQSHRLIHSSGVHPHNIIYLIEGSVFSLSADKRKLVHSVITSLNHFKGMTVIKTASVAESAEFILSFADKVNRNLSKKMMPKYWSEYTNIPPSTPEQVDTDTNVRIEKSGGVAEGHDVGFLLYCGERPKGARRNIEKSGGVVKDHEVEIMLSSEERPNPTFLVGYTDPKVRSKRGVTGGEAPNGEVHMNILQSNETVESIEIPDNESKVECIFKETPVEEVNEHDYVSVVKKVKKDNLTPKNIGAVFLSQIPLVSSVIANAIMVKYQYSISLLMKELEKDPDCLNFIQTEKDGKKRKIGSNVVKNIRLFLLKNPEELPKATT